MMKTEPCFIIFPNLRFITHNTKLAIIISSGQKVTVHKFNLGEFGLPSFLKDTFTNCAHRCRGTRT